MGKLVKAVYGDALFSLAKENYSTEEVREEVKGILEVLKNNPKIFMLMEHPRIGKKEKVSLVEEAFLGKVTDTMLGFLVLITEKGHFRQVEGIFEYFEQCYRNYHNIALVKVISATELTKKQKEQIYRKVRNTTGYRALEMEYEVDSSLIGGIVVRLGDKRLDGSVKNRLKQLTRELNEGVVTCS